MRDFSLKKYCELCKAILEEYTPMTVASYLTEKPSGKIVILRHDVDRGPEDALRMAKIEKKYGITSTYYFRMKKNIFIPRIINEIADMGHEVGYHYEVLDKARGDFDRAIKIFEEELRKFREICEVKTICMHGNPFTPWINKDLWKKYDFRKYGIIGEPYISINYRKVIYLSDTGRTWSGMYSVKDKIKIGENLGIKKTNDLIKFIRDGQAQQICILIHPARWSDNYIDWIIELLRQNMKNAMKSIIKWRRRRYDYN